MTVLARLGGWLSRTAMVGMVAAPIGLAAGWAGTAMLSGPAVTLTSIVEADGVAVRGGLIDLVVHVRRDRWCPAETQRYLWRWAERDGERVPQFVPLPPTVAPPGTDAPVLILSLPVPPTLDPGEWFYRAITTEHCAWLPAPFRAVVRQTPDVPVEIR